MIIIIGGSTSNKLDFLNKKCLKRYCPRCDQSQCIGSDDVSGHPYCHTGVSRDDILYHGGCRSVASVHRPPPHECSAAAAVFAGPVEAEQSEYTNIEDSVNFGSDITVHQYSRQQNELLKKVR